MTRRKAQNGAGGTPHLPLHARRRRPTHGEFACQAKRRRLCKLIAFGSFPRHRPVVVNVARRGGLGTSGENGRAGATSALSAAFPAPSAGRLRPKSANVRLRPVAGGRDPEASRRRFEWRPSNGDEVESAEFQGRDVRIARIDLHSDHTEFAGGPRRPASLRRSSRQRVRSVAIVPAFCQTPTHRRRSRGRDAPNESVAGRVVAPRENLPCQTR